MKTSRKKNNRGLWVTLLIAIVGVGYGYLVFLPGQKKIAATQSELNEQQRYIVQATRLTSSINYAEKHLVIAKEKALAWAERSPDLRNLAEVYARISADAEEVQTVIASFDPQPPVLLSTIHRVPVRVGCRGTYAQLFAFLARLEQMPASIWIDQMTILPSENMGRTLRCEFTLTIFVKGNDFSG